MHLNPRSVGGGSIHCYRINPPLSGRPPLELEHKTAVDEVPLTMCPFEHEGKVLIGVGKLLRLYDYGKKKLLRKSENKVRPRRG